VKLVETFLGTSLNPLSASMLPYPEGTSTLAHPSSPPKAYQSSQLKRLEEGGGATAGQGRLRSSTVSPLSAPVCYTPQIRDTSAPGGGGG